jgi:hypothetical protein
MVVAWKEKRITRDWRVKSNYDRFGIYHSTFLESINVQESDIC